MKYTRIRDLREDRDMNQTELAKMLGMSQTGYSKYRPGNFSCQAFLPAQEYAQQIREADLLITHHPLIFQPVKSVTDDTSIGRTILKLIRNDISAINAHTNLDCAPGGVNDVLAHALELTDVEVVNPTGLDAEGNPYGLLRMGCFEAALPDFLSHVKRKLGTPVLRYTDGGKPVRKVAVGGGACAGAVVEAYHAGCDTFVTADVKYNQFWDAQDLGMNLIDAGHFYTENPVIDVLAEKLRAQFPNIEVIISKTHRDCMKFY